MAHYRLEDLTPRQREIFERLSMGDSSKYIGLALGISHFTVETHKQYIDKKLGKDWRKLRLSKSQSRIGAIIEAWRSGQSGREIADKFGITRRAVTSLICYYRKKGADIPPVNDAERRQRISRGWRRLHD